MKTERRSLRAAASPGSVRHNLDGHAERLEDVGEPPGAGARRQRGRSDPERRDLPEQRDVGEPCSDPGHPGGNVVLQLR